MDRLVKNYEKLYKESLEKAKGIINYYKEHNRGDEASIEDLEEIFPELTESEDEKIRKGIIRNLEYLMNRAEGFVKDELKKRIAWLEKQGKKEQDARYKYLEELLEADTIYQMAMNDAMVAEAKNKAINALQELSVSKLLGLKKLEKRGKQKSQRKSALEAIKEEKIDNANKIEPKFKVGDWCIDNEDGTIFQIVKVLDNTYTYKTNVGKEYSCTHYSLENDAKHWTIQDAKDGDVLADKYNNIGIFQECKGICWHSYIYLGCDGELRGFNIGGSHEQTGTHPATKEQREQLEKAMADAGYEWDAEKKELKHDENE